MSPHLRFSARASAAAVVVALLAACGDAPIQPPEVAPPLLQVEDDATLSGDPAAQLSAQMDAINAFLDGEAADYRVMMAEYIAGGDAAGATVIQKDVGNKRLGADFVPNDARRGWSGPAGGPSDDITYVIDQVDAVPVFSDASAAQTTAAIVSAMDTWDAETCSDLPLTQVDDQDEDLGIIASIFGLGGGPFVLADVMHTGFRDINFGGGILGVAFTFVFIDGSGVPTDIDGNGLADVAFREIYYDPSFFWSTSPEQGEVDVESIALHEAGHGLSQAHFGNIFIKKGQLSASPQAVMNAFYPGGEQRSLAGTDRGGHCSNWANWPNN